ncbi:hypothetical protein [Paracoccus sediminilitoris]|uniref:hypothetical protein n=1 Tax=Paracoccus sediminilitoris TaxID=2202419 RepID=UPI0011B93E02|nr:hypothetical protein [Paracoccus sediminilitoris]
MATPDYLPWRNSNAPFKKTILTHLVQGQVVRDRWSRVEPSSLLDCRAFRGAAFFVIRQKRINS